MNFWTFLPFQMFWYVVFSVSLLKFLLIPYYTSTDFEVHRNWLAITHSLPLNQWYTEDRSQWTLDYPPFFAWFEYVMSQAAKFIDPKMLNVDNLEYKSFETVVFQRTTVIVTDLVLAFGIHVCSSGMVRSRRENAVRDELVAMIMTNAGLIMVDHVHFQYNGILIGILLSSIGYMLKGSFLKSAALFVLLLNMKHIFLYCAPAYFVYLLTTYCYPRLPNSVMSKFMNLVALGVVVIIGFGLSMGPFISQIPQLLSRLFPFKRGLTHAYWAPNFWAVYSGLDRLAVMAAKAVDPTFQVLEDAKPTTGLVQESVFVMLPSIPPAVTFALTLAGMIPLLWTLWNQPNHGYGFTRSLILCTFTSYMFGWHVHEKAILLVTIPSVILVVAHPGTAESRIYLLLSIVGNFSLFPLLFRVQETLLKVTIWLFHLAVCFYFKNQTSIKGKRRRDGLRWFEQVYLLGLPLIFLFPTISDLINPVILQKFQFLPLMMYSLYCSVGTVYCYANLYLNYVFSSL